jgi:hypothetical protein
VHYAVVASDNAANAQQLSAASTVDLPVLAGIRNLNFPLGEKFATACLILKFLRDLNADHFTGLSVREKDLP